MSGPSGGDRGAARDARGGDQDDLDAFEGEWVVLRDGAVVDHDPDPDALRERAEPLAPGDAIVPIGHPPAGYQVIA